MSPTQRSSGSAAIITPMAQNRRIATPGSRRRKNVEIRSPIPCGNDFDQHDEIEAFSSQCPEKEGNQEEDEKEGNSGGVDEEDGIVQISVPRQ